VARTPKFTFKNTPRGWQVNVPATLAASGKRERQFFETRDKAKAAATALREKFQEHGAAASIIRPALAEDASRAAAILEPWGASLLEAAKAFAAIREREAASKLLGEAAESWWEWLLSPERETQVKARPRPRTLQGYRQIKAKLVAALGERLLATITVDDLQAVITPPGTPPTMAASNHRCARVFWNWAASKGWCRADVITGVQTRKPDRSGEIAILTVPEVAKLLAVAEEHFPQAAPSYAIQLFAGVRPAELRRLNAEHVTDEGIELGASTTKKRSRRHIVPSKTLAAWLARYPFKPCKNWKRVDDACRWLAGWDVTPPAGMVEADVVKKTKKAVRPPWPQNAIRHTHATYSVTAGVEIETLLFEFGHTASPEVLRAHYKGVASKKAALAFFALRPGGVKAPAAANFETVEGAA